MVETAHACSASALARRPFIGLSTGHFNRRHPPASDRGRPATSCRSPRQPPPRPRTCESTEKPALNRASGNLLVIMLLSGYESFVSKLHMTSRIGRH
jgi:hypothetical protein